MLPIVASRLWYTGGENYVGYGDRPPRTAPPKGVQVIAYYHAAPYVTYAHGNWEGYHWAENPADVWFTSGPSMPDEAFATLLARAKRASRP